MAKYKIDTTSARAKLAVRREPYFVSLGKGKALGFRRTTKGGNWIARQTVGSKKAYMALDGVAEYDEAVTAATNWFNGAAKASKHNYRVRDALAAYEQSLSEANRANTLRSFQTLINKIPDTFADRYVFSLTTPDVRDLFKGWVNWERDGDALRKSKSSANRHLAVLKAALNRAYNDGMVDTDKAWSRVKPYKGVTAKNPLLLSDADVAHCIDVAKPHFKPLLKACALTGARYLELANMEVGDFDRKAKTLTVQDKDGAKTGGRTIFLGAAAVVFFTEQCRDKLPLAPMFTRSDGNRYRGSNQKDEFVTIRRNTKKLPAGTTFYSFRHYHISKAMAAGVPIQIIAENCGTSVKMIEQTYGKFEDAVRQSFINQLDVSV